MKYALLAALAFSLTGCGWVQRVWTHYTGELTYKCTKANTTAIQSDSGIAMLLDAEGKTVPCK